MNTTWRVTKVTAIEGKTTADLVQVEWFKQTDAWSLQVAEFQRIEEAEGTEAADAALLEWPEVPEWMDDVPPGTEGAEFFEVGGFMSVDITDGLALRPGDNVRVSLDAMERVTT